MNNKKIYIICSILFLAIVTILVLGFNGTYSAPDEFEIPIYWAVDGDECEEETAKCTFTLSNNEIEGSHFDNGIVDGAITYSDSSIPWSKYSKNIISMTIGSENDVIRPKSTAYWFYYFGVYVDDLNFNFLDTSQVEDMSYMFYHFGRSKNDEFYLDLSMIDTSQVKNMSNMFNSLGISHRFELDLTGWDTSNVTNMSNMFSVAGGGNCYLDHYWNVKGLDNFDTSNVTDMSLMFSGCDFETLDLSNWNVSNVINMYGMFTYTGCGDSCNLNLSGWDTSNVRNMSYMFESAGDINIIGIENFNTKNVLNMGHMFSYFRKFANNITWDLSNWNTSKVTNMKSMFSNFGIEAKSVSLDLTGWDTSNVTNMSYMFNDTYKNSLILDISNFDTSKVIDSGNVFNDFDQIKVGDKWDLPLTSQNVINKETGELYNGENIPKNTDATYIIPKLYYTVVNLGNKKYKLYISNKKISNKEIGYQTIQESRIINFQDDLHSSYLNDIIEVKILGDENNYVIASPNEKWFSDMPNLQSVDFTYLDTRYVMNSNGFFPNNENISVKIGKKYGLEFNEGNWKDVETGIIYSGNQVPTNINATYRLYNENTYWTVNGKKLIISNNKISGNNANGIINLTKHYEIDEIPWKDYSSIIEKVVFDGDVSPVYMDNWFLNFKKLKEINFNGLNTSKTISMSGTFAYCYSLESINLESLDLSNVEDMSSLFYNSQSLKNIKMGNISNLIYADKIFANLLYVDELIIDKFNTSNIEYYDDMFENIYLRKITVGEDWGLPFPESEYLYKDVLTNINYDYDEIPLNCAATYILDNDELLYWNIENGILNISNNEFNDGEYFGYFNSYYNFIPWTIHYDIIEKVIIGYENDIVKPYEIYGWYFDLKNVKEIDVTYLDTTLVHNMNSAFSIYSTDDSVVGERPSSKIERIIGIENLNTSNVINMKSLFGFNGYLAELDLSDWDTSNVTNMSHMFDYTDSLKKVIVGDKWNLSLSEETWINEKTSEAYEYGEIPENVSAIYIRPIVYWAINDNKLTISNNYIEGNVDYGMLNTMKHIFNQNSWQYDYENDHEYPYNDIIKEVQIGGKDDIIKPYSIDSWFSSLYKITELDLTHLDTSNVYDMSYAFSTGYCTEWYDESTCSSSLNKIIGIENLDTSNAIDMSGIFAYNYILKELDLSGWNTSKVENMSRIFYNCEKIVELNLSGWNTSNLIDTEEMFSNCINLEELDLSSWDTSQVEYGYIFYNNALLKKITVGENWTLPLSEDKWISATTGLEYEDGEVPSNVADTYTKDLSNYVYWQVDNNTLKFSNNSIIGDITGVYNISLSIDEQHSWKDYIDNYTIEKVIFGGENDIIKPYNMYLWFRNFYNLKEVDSTYLDTSNLIDVEDMFSNCTNLEELDLSSWNTSQVEYGYMFYNNALLQKITVGENWTLPLSEDKWISTNTGLEYEDGEIPSNVSDTYIKDLSNYLFWSVNDNILTISNEYSSGNVANGGFYRYDYLYDSPWEEYCDVITEVKIGSENDIVKLNSMDNYFINLGKLKKIDISYLDSSELYSIDFSAFAYEDLDDTSTWTSSLERIIGLDKLNTSNITDMINMFRGDSNLKELDLSNFDTSNVTDISYMFYNCKSLTSLDLSSFDLSNIMYDVEEIYVNNYSIKEVKVGDKWNIELYDATWKDKLSGQVYKNGNIPKNTAAVYERNVAYWTIDDNILLVCNNPVYTTSQYYGAIDLNSNNNQLWQNYSSMIEEVKIGSENDIISPTNMDKWFKGLYKVKELDLTYLDTSNTTSMDNTFSTGYCEKANDEKTCSSSLTKIIGLDKLNTNKVTKMTGIFSNNYSLKELDISSFDTSNVMFMNNMFENNWNLEKITGLSKLVTANVRNLDNIFNGCKSLSKLDLSNFETNKVEGFENMFSDMTKLIKITVGEKFDLPLSKETWISNTTSNIYYDGEIPTFNSDTYYRTILYWAVNNDTLTISNNYITGNIDNGSFDINTSFMSNTYNRIYHGYKDIIKNVIVGNEDDILKPIIIDRWFSGLENVKKLDLSYLDTSNVVSAEELFYNMTSLEKLNIQNLDFSKLNENVESSNINLYTKVKDSLSNNNLFLNNYSLKLISIGTNNAKIVKESLSNPNSYYIDDTAGKWFDINGNSYDVSELPENIDGIYYATKPYIVSYNMDNVAPQGKVQGEDLTLYSEILKDSNTEEIITKFNTDGGNDIADITSLKITTYTLKNFTDNQKNIYLPGSKYTRDKDLELDVNYDEEVHYNSIELPIPVKEGNVFVGWVIDSRILNEYTPKENMTLLAIWESVKYHFNEGTENVEYKKNSKKSVEFITDGNIENFEDLFINGKKLEKDTDYILKNNKIILIEKGLEYLEELEQGKYEVKAKYNNSNSYTYGIITINDDEDKEITEKEEDQPKTNPDEERDKEQKQQKENEQSSDKPNTPKTGDYILITFIVLVTSLLASYVIYKKI